MTFTLSSMPAPDAGGDDADDEQHEHGVEQKRVEAGRDRPEQRVRLGRIGERESLGDADEGVPEEPARDDAVVRQDDEAGDDGQPAGVRPRPATQLPQRPRDSGRSDGR